MSSHWRPINEDCANPGGLAPEQVWPLRIVVREENPSRQRILIAHRYCAKLRLGHWAVNGMGWA